MERLQKKRIHLIYGLLVSLSAVVAGVCLAAACINIYMSGESSFTREVVAESFAAIAWPVYVCMVLVIGGFLLNVFWPLEQEKLIPAKQWSVILQRRRSTVDLRLCGGELRLQVAKEIRARERMGISLAVITLLGGVIFLRHALNGDNFHQTDINGSMITAMKVMLPCLIAPFGYGLYCCRYFKQSMRREAEALKQAPAEAKIPAGERQYSDEKYLTALRLMLLCAALVLLVYGAAMDGTADVLTKAVNICTECIGLG